MMTFGIVLGLASVLLPPAAAPPVPDRKLCHNATGTHDGFFHTFWKDGGDACMTLSAGGRYAVRYRLGERQNMVVGVGWRNGSADRAIGYRAERFDAGTNSYLTLYGWSVDPLVEYYVVDDWGARFTPPGGDAKPLGTVESDGGTYTIYRTRRVSQPSIRGTATFDQYWSVRTVRRQGGADRRISFANHVAAWRQHGMTLGTMDYQVLATEGFGSTGHADIRVWHEPPAGTVH